MKRGREGAATYELEMIPDSDIAVFTWRGPITLADRKNNAKLMARFCAEHGTHRLIVDGRQQVPRTSTLEAFEFGQSVPVELNGLCIAVVYRQDDEALPFIETVAHNRGSCTKAFLDFDDARNWLESFCSTSANQGMA